MKVFLFFLIESICDSKNYTDTFTFEGIKMKWGACCHSDIQTNALFCLLLNMPKVQQICRRFVGFSSPKSKCES